MTYREFRVIRAWMEERWNSPSRSDHYLMQIAMIGQQIGGSKVRDLNKFKIPFKGSRPKIKRPLTKKELDKMSEEALKVWLQRLGKKSI